MRVSPGASVKKLVQVSIAPSIAFTLQLANAVVELPLADMSGKLFPVEPNALFQCVAVTGSTPADSLGSIATVPDAPAAPFGDPPTKSMLMIMGDGALSVPTSPVPPVAGPSLASVLGASGAPVSAVSDATMPRSDGKFVSAENGTSIPTS